MPDPQTGPVRRSRKLPLKNCEGKWHEAAIDTGVLYGKPYANTAYDSRGTFKGTGTQITVSEGHPFNSRDKRKKMEDIGGPFFTTKSYVAEQPFQPHRLSKAVFNPFSNATRTYTYQGPIAAVGPDSSGALSYPPDASRSDQELAALGATAIARTNPSNPLVDLSTTLGELFTGGIPSLVGSSLWKDRLDLARKAGSEYLNAQFGWLPLLSDIRGFAEVMRNANIVLKQYERDAGKVVRRRYEFPTEVQESETNHGNTSPYTGGSGGNIFSGQARLIRHDRITRRVWFSGAFTYYLPTGYNARNEVDRLALLADRVGLDLTPETLWNLAPWSWAVDWFSNAGDVVSNVSRFEVDGTVLVYGYIMEHTIASRTYSMDNVPLQGGGYAYVQPVTLVTETKKRIAASPYGFDIGWADFDSFQLSILAALGITKGRR